MYEKYASLLVMHISSRYVSDRTRKAASDFRGAKIVPVSPLFDLLGNALFQRTSPGVLVTRCFLDRVVLAKPI